MSLIGDMAKASIKAATDVAKENLERKREEKERIERGPSYENRLIIEAKGFKFKHGYSVITNNGILKYNAILHEYNNRKDNIICSIYDTNASELASIYLNSAYERTQSDQFDIVIYNKRVGGLNRHDKFLNYKYIISIPDCEIVKGKQNNLFKLLKNNSEIIRFNTISIKTKNPILGFQIRTKTSWSVQYLNNEDELLALLLCLFYERDRKHFDDRLVGPEGEG